MLRKTQAQMVTARHRGVRGHSAHTLGTSLASHGSKRGTECTEAPGKRGGLSVSGVYPQRSARQRRQGSPGCLLPAPFLACAGLLWTPAAQTAQGDKRTKGRGRDESKGSAWFSLAGPRQSPLHEGALRGWLTGTVRHPSHFLVQGEAPGAPVRTGEPGHWFLAGGKSFQ